MNDDRYWMVSSVINDDERSLEKIRHLRPHSNPSSFDWQDIEKKLGFEFSPTDRRDLREALVSLVAHIRRCEFEADHGRQIDEELESVIKGANELAERLLKLEANIAEIVKCAAGDPKLVAAELSKFADAVGKLTAPKRKPGSPPPCVVKRTSPIGFSESGVAEPRLRSAELGTTRTTGN